MDRENIIDTTKKRLQEFDLGDLKHYNQQTQEQFYSLEKYFLDNEESLDNALEKINSINFNIRGICEATGISKSTVYGKKNTLLLYIQKRIEEIEKQDPLMKNKQLKAKERLFELEKQLDRMIIDQIEYNNLKIVVEDLQKEVNRLFKQNELLALDRSVQVNTINGLKEELRSLRKKKGNVIGIN